MSLYIYDANGTLVQTKHIKQNDLKAFQGTKLQLSKGVYEVVGVGNVFNKTTVTAPAQGNMSDRYFNHPNADNSGKVEGNDSLYLGRQTLNVPNDWYEADVPFRSSHLKVSYQVIAENAQWTTIHDTSDTHYTLQVNNLKPKTNFENTAFGTPITYDPVLTLDAESLAHNSYFNIMRHPKQSDVEFVLTEKATGEIIHRLRLEDFLSEFKVIDVTKQEVLIPIVIKLVYQKNICADVVVAIPDWVVNDVTPGFGDNK